MKVAAEKKVIELLSSQELSDATQREDNKRLRDVINKITKLLVHLYDTRATNSLLRLFKVLPLHEQEALTQISVEKWETPYQLGRLSGTLSVLKELSFKQADEVEAEEARSLAPKYFDRIIAHLGTHNKDSSGNIAALLGVSPSNISNILKRMIVSGTVYRENAGKIHYYRLTPLGVKLWEKQQVQSPIRFSDLEEDEKAESETFGLNYKVGLFTESSTFYHRPEHSVEIDEFLVMKSMNNGQTNFRYSSH